MVKSIEAIMAIMILFLFILVLFNNYSYSDYKENIAIEKINQAIYLKSQEESFRNYIIAENTESIYHSFYDFIDTNYSIALCDFFNSECLSFGDSVPEDRSLYSSSYYFYDSNKTLNIIIWT
jgi:hypothetical protein